MRNVLILLTGSIGLVAGAAEYHVAKNGSDSDVGAEAKPFLTISRAAEVARPGDQIMVHSGIYRERIDPPHGGAKGRRIVYRAVDDDVVIKGSEVVQDWAHLGEGVWSVVIPNTFFGDYNPYAEPINGDWFNGKGRVHHTGEVYLNEAALYEEISLDKIKGREQSWFAKVDGAQTKLWANFGMDNPNLECVEINVRPACFYPSETGRNYITVSGFTMRHAATQWAAPTAEQIGLIGTHWSKGWIIENNTISDSKCVGITLGKDRISGHNVWSKNKAKSGNIHYNEVIEEALKIGWSKQTIGSHVVRNNTIYDCGAAGICGSMGCAFSLVENNHIYRINHQKPFTGHEQAGIKFHGAIDSVIRNNLVHDTYRGIWMDWMTQGTRVSANVCYRNATEDIYFEANHGPYVADHNICLSSTPLHDRSEGGAYAHNLFRGRRLALKKDLSRDTPYHKPHSTQKAGMSKMLGRDIQYYNNIFIGAGLDGLNKNESVRVDGNVYLTKAQPHKTDANKIHQMDFDPQIEIIEASDGVYLMLTLPAQMADQINQRVTTERLGKVSFVDAGFENPDGTPISIDRDYFGAKRNSENSMAGPFRALPEGRSKIKVWEYRSGK